MAKTSDRYLVEQLNPDYGYFVRAGDPVATGKTRFQELEVFDTPMFGRMLRLDRVFMTTERDEFFYHEPIVHVPAIAHPAPRRALVIGGGDGGSSEELLKHPSIEQVVLAELDEGVVDASKKYLQSIHRGVFEDPRLDLRIMDGKAYVESTTDRFDLIVLDLTDPHGPSQALYTVEFYAACREILRPEGLLSLHTESPISRPRTYSRIIRTLQGAFPIVRPYLAYVPIYGTWWGMATASAQTDPRQIISAEVDSRIAERGLRDLQLYNGEMHQAMLALPNFVRQLIAQPADPIRADSPPLEDEIALNQTSDLEIIPLRRE